MRRPDEPIRPEQPDFDEVADLEFSGADIQANELAEAVAEEGLQRERAKGRKGNSMFGGMAWTLVRTTGIAIVQFSVIVALSRLMSKTEVGYAQTALIISNFAQLFAQIGIAPAIIQRPEITNKHLATGFIASLTSGFVQMCVILLGAGAIARFMHMPEAEGVFRLVAFVFGINAISRIALVRLQRDLLFQRIAKAELISNLCYGITAVALAALHFGAYAMVYGLIVQAIVLAAIMLTAEPIPRPFRFDREAFRDLMSVAKGFSMATILGYVASQSDNFIVGRWLGAADLGLYSRAYNLMSRPANMVALTINRVLYPIMARNQDQPTVLRKLFVLTSIGLAAIIFPIGFFGCVMGPEIFHSLLGHEWEGAILPFQIFAAGMIFRVGNQSSDVITKAVGSAYARVLPRAFYAIAVVVGAYLGAVFGPAWFHSSNPSFSGGLLGATLGVLLANILHTVQMVDQSFKIIPMTWGQYLRAHGGALAIGLAFSIPAFMVAEPLRAMHLSAPLILVSATVVSMVVGLAYVIFGGPALIGHDLVDIRGRVIRKFGGKFLKKLGRRGGKASA